MEYRRENTEESRYKRIENREERRGTYNIYSIRDNISNWEPVTSTREKRGDDNREERRERMTTERIEDIRDKRK